MTDPAGDPPIEKKEHDSFESPAQDSELLALDTESATASSDTDDPSGPAVDLDQRLGVTPTGAIPLPEAMESHGDEEVIAIDEVTIDDSSSRKADAEEIPVDSDAANQDGVTGTGGDPVTLRPDEPALETAEPPDEAAPDGEPESFAAEEQVEGPEAGQQSPEAVAAEGGGSRFSNIWQRMSGSAATDPAADVKAPPGVANQPESPSMREQLASRFRMFLDPAANRIDLTWHRRLVAAVVVVVLLLLMANQAGAALIVSSAVVPLLIVMILSSHDVFERESNLVLLGIGLLGVIVGIVFGGISAWIVGSQWFNQGHLNFGAGGFGGRFAPDVAPFLVWLVSGLLVPAATVAGIAAVPIVLRRWPRFANEVMDGMILAGTSAAGVAIGLAATFWWPMTFGDGPLMNVSDWTLTILGQVFLRPLVITLGGAAIGAGVWRYMLADSGGPLAAAPAVAGALGILLLWLGSIGTQPSGIWPEFLLTALLALVMFAVYRTTLDRAIQTDSAVLGGEGVRLICPHCRQVTPVGTFCGRCGQTLSQVDGNGSAG